MNRLADVNESLAMASVGAYHLHSPNSLCFLSLPSSASVSPPIASSSSSDASSKTVSRLLSRLRNSSSPLKSTLRKSQHLPKSALLATLRQLLQQQDWQLALPLYRSISETAWYRWNAHLHAHIVALLTKFEQQQQVDLFMVGIDEKLDSKHLINLYSALIQYYGRYGLREEMLAAYKCLQAFPYPGCMFLSSSALVQAYALMDLPKEAEEIMREMQSKGIKSSLEGFKAVLFSYGRCGLYVEMESVALEMEKSGQLFRPVVFNMILTIYATAQNHNKIQEWLNKMLAADLRPSVRSLNALAKACPVLNSICAESTRSTCLSPDSLLEKLEAHGATRGETQTVNFLLDLSIPPEAVVWAPHWQIDLHSTAIASAYVMLLCWLKELLRRLNAASGFPAEIVIVTGWGRHSDVRGSSSVRSMVMNLLANSKSPFLVDRKNKGRLLARPHAMVSWLSQL